MQPKEFAKWKQKRLLGLSLKVVAPTGQYCGTKLINWDSNRWAFKPELGYRALGPLGARWLCWSVVLHFKPSILRWPGHQTTE